MFVKRENCLINLDHCSSVQRIDDTIEFNFNMLNEVGFMETIFCYGSKGLAEESFQDICNGLYLKQEFVNLDD